MFELLVEKLKHTAGGVTMLQRQDLPWDHWMQRDLVFTPGRRNRYTGEPYSLVSIQSWKINTDWKTFDETCP